MPISFDDSKLVDGNELPGIFARLKSQFLNTQLLNRQFFKTADAKEQLVNAQSVNVPVRIASGSSLTSLNFSS